MYWCVDVPLFPHPVYACVIQNIVNSRYQIKLREEETREKDYLIITVYMNCIVLCLLYLKFKIVNATLHYLA